MAFSKKPLRIWLIGIGSVCVLLFAASLFFLWWQEEQILARHKDPGEKQFVELLRRDKQKLSSRLSKEDRITYTMDLGLQWYVLGENERAIQWWNKGLKLHPQNEIGWYNLGNAYRRLKDYVNAEKSYQRSIDVAKGGEINGCLALGELYRMDYIEKRTSEPEVYKQCLEKSPNNRDLVAHLAVYYRDSGDRKQAVHYFDQLFALEPTVEVSEELRKLRE